MVAKDISGQRFGRLTVLEYVYSQDKNRYYRVRCDCGVEFNVARTNLVQGRTRSCGCLRREWLINSNPMRRKK